MSAISQHSIPQAQRRCLELQTPDWSACESLTASPLPFILWRVGYQPLLHHWLDYAVNQGHTHVRLFCQDRPHLVRKALQEATLWPLTWELIPAAPAGNGVAPVQANALPIEGCPVPPASFGNEWDLMDYWFSLERACFNALHFEGRTEDLELWIGRFSQVDPSARLQFPLWIGDNVYIGPNTEIGPYASIGNDCVIEGNSRIIHAKIADNTFLGAHTHVEMAYLDGERLLNRKHRAAVSMRDAFVACRVHRQPTQRCGPGLRERLEAAFWYAAFLTKDAMSGFSSREFWASRYPELLETVFSRRRLFGIRPRRDEHLAALPDEWREILGHEPAGVFSCADIQGCHDPGDEMEAVHAVFHATQPAHTVADACRRFLRGLLFSPASSPKTRATA